MPSEKKEKSFGHLSKRVGGCSHQNKKKIKFYFGQEHRDGGGKNSLSKIKKNSKNMVKVPLLSVFLGDRSLIKELYIGKTL